MIRISEIHRTIEHRAMSIFNCIKTYKGRLRMLLRIVRTITHEPVCDLIELKPFT
jgi:hypothetical protein